MKSFVPFSRIVALAGERGSLRRRLFEGGVGSVLAQVLSRFVVLGLGVTLARALGADGYGVYAYAFAVMTLLLVAAEVGVPTLLLREVAASHAREDWAMLRGAITRGWQLVAVISTVIGVLGIVVLLMNRYSLPDDVFWTDLIMLLALPLVAMSNTWASVLRGLRYVVTAQAVEMLLRPGLVLLLLLLLFSCFPSFRTPYFAMAVQLFVASVVAIVGFRLVRRSVPIPARNVAPKYGGSIWVRSALPFLLIGGAGIINNQVDILVLGWFRPLSDVGVYRVAVQGSGLVGFGLVAANSVIAPYLADLYTRNDMALLQRVAAQSARLVSIIALPIALLMIFAGGPLAGWVFGSEFFSVQKPLAILAIGQLTNAFFGSVGFILNMTGHEMDVARSLTVSAALNFGLCILLIPFVGMIGAAIASGMSLVVWNLLLFRVVRMRVGVVSAAVVFRFMK